MEFPVSLSEGLLKKARALRIFTKDISESFVRGSGSGGQKINKTSSCVLLRHIPTGTEVRCQKHREQSKNRLSAYKLLILKIEERVMGRRSALAAEKFKIKKQKKLRSRRSKEKMLEAKRHRSEIKEMRKNLRSQSGI